MESDSLKSFLVGLPSRLNYKNNNELKEIIFRALYYFSTNSGQDLKKLFPYIGEEKYNNINKDPFTTNVNKSNKYFTNKNENKKKKYTHFSNKVCARPFEKGDPVYKCEECCYDQTCVICIHCFNINDHINHNVSMYVSKGENVGACDCGDPDAFKKELHCQSITEIKQNDIFDTKENLEPTLETCLNYVIDVFYFSVCTLPIINDYIKKKEDYEIYKLISDYSSFPSDKYNGTVDLNSENIWYLILWNDEHHNTTQANNSILYATNFDECTSNNIVNKVNLNGRCILLESDSYINLISPKKKAESNGLVLTIMSARDYMRENIANYIIDWIEEVIMFNNNAHFSELCRSIFSNLLLNSDFSFSKPFPKDFFSNINSYDSESFYKNGLIIDGAFKNFFHSKVKSSIEPEDLLNSIDTILTYDDRLNFLKYSRLQIFLIFNLRFTSITRKKISKILTSTIISDLEKKKSFSKQIIKIYPLLTFITALSDRENHLNCLIEITTQIFTCPNISLFILKNDYFGTIISSIIQLIEKNPILWNHFNLRNDFVNLNIKYTQESIAFKKIILREIHDLSCLVTKENFKLNKNFFLQKNNLIYFLLFLKNFQNYWPLKRKLDTHVERDVFDFFIYLEYSIPVLNIVKTISSFNYDDDTTKNSVLIILKFLDLTNSNINFLVGDDFKVSKDLVSFINTINSLLSFLIQNKNILMFNDIIKNNLNSLKKAADKSLRSIVLASQINIGFWVRNGVSASRQASFYYDTIMNDLTFFRDFHLNQIFAIYCDPKDLLKFFLNRWELLDWFTSTNTYDNTVYEDKFFSIMEKFIIFLFNLITDKTNLINISPEEKLIFKIKRSLIHALCDEPKSYSSFERFLISEIKESPSFDKILNELTIFQQPSTLTDSGLYRLKTVFYDQIDFLSLYLSSNKFQSVSKILAKHLASKKNVNEDEVILEPYIISSGDKIIDEKISNFTRETDFAKFVYKCLQASIEKSNEIFLSSLLHLIHAVLSLNLNLFGSDYLCNNFVLIPISHLLLSVVDSNFSKSLVQKADFLVNQFISKDKDVYDSLLNSFGKSYMENLKKNKQGLFESFFEKKKRLAEERKAKIFKKFLKQRKKFIDLNNDFKQDLNLYLKISEEKSVIKLRSCVSCGDYENLNDMFGVLTSLTKSSFFWKIPQETSNFVSNAFLNWDDQNFIETNDLYEKGYDYNYYIKNFVHKIIENNISFTCGHGMHYNCFKKIFKKNNYFSCPLCHNIHNFFVPTFRISNEEDVLEEEKLLTTTDGFNLDEVVDYTGTNNLSILFDSFINRDYLDPEKNLMSTYAKIIEENVANTLTEIHYFTKIDQNKTFFNYTQNFITLITKTIKINEISTRIDGEKGLKEFPLLINGSIKSLIISLIQCILILFKNYGFYKSSKINLDSSFDFKEFLYNDKRTNCFFNEFVLMFFHTNESFLTCAKFGFCKLIITSIYFFILNLKRNPKYLDFLPQNNKCNLDSNLKTAINKLIYLINDKIKLDFSNLKIHDLPSLFYFLIERSSLPYLRNLIIFFDLLTSHHINDNIYESIEKFTSLKDRIESQETLYSTTALTEFLNLPCLNDLICNLANHKNTHNFKLEHQLYNYLLNNLLIKFQTSKIALDYPGIIRLIKLPKDYSFCITDYVNNFSKSYDFAVCLNCGQKLNVLKFSQHKLICVDEMCIFFLPRFNKLKIFVSISNIPTCIEIPAPYLTIHGEAKDPKSNGKSVLNVFRYRYLNKLLINQGLYSFVTRNLLNSRNFEETTQIELNIDRAFIMDDDDLIYQGFDTFLW